MDAQEVLDEIEKGEDAYFILIEKMPTIERRFKRLDAALIKLINDVKKEFPDACYYTASGGFHLMLGPSHSDKAQSQQELVALSGNAQIGDGDF